MSHVGYTIDHLYQIRAQVKLPFRALAADGLKVHLPATDYRQESQQKEMTTYTSACSLYKYVHPSVSQTSAILGHLC